jgi:hypothetical protein
MYGCKYDVILSREKDLHFIRIATAMVPTLRKGRYTSKTTSDSTLVACAHLDLH